ncbi:heme exporter protein CcmB [Balneola sp. MJW-20]|uniref:heme exporter protein CcmB n=1 Tax=Gracilimonas aurantiaca TaxID=3234185 RepID=UPI0034A6AA73
MNKCLNLAMSWFRQTKSILRKDLQIEWRTRFAINMVIAFVVASLMLILFTIRADQLDPIPRSALVWIIILFASLSTLSRSFLTETDKRTYDLLKIYSAGKGSPVFSGKLINNYLFSLAVNIITFTLYLFLVNLSIVSWPAFLVILFLGTAGISGVSTLVAAIVSQADRKGAIFSILSIPLFVPMILLLTDLTKVAFVSAELSTETQSLWALVGFVGVMVTAGSILFDYIWEE